MEIIFYAKKIQDVILRMFNIIRKIKIILHLVKSMKMTIKMLLVIIIFFQNNQIKYLTKHIKINNIFLNTRII